MRLTKKREKKINNAMNTKEDMIKGTSELKKQNVHQSYKGTSVINWPVS